MYRLKRRAGFYRMGAEKANILPHQVTTIDITCSYEWTFDIHPFAFRVHTHDLGEPFTFFVYSTFYVLVNI